MKYDAEVKISLKKGMLNPVIHNYEIGINPEE